MELPRRSSLPASRLGVFPGTFNPPTRAHLELAAAALEFVDEVLFVMPRRLPHKAYEGVGLAARMRLLEICISTEPRYSLGVTEGGLFADIARECRSVYGPEVRLEFICGTDAAERFWNWDYGEAGAAADQLKEFGLLVASRGRSFHVPRNLAARVRRLNLTADWSAVSATEVRERIRRGEPWEHLVPPPAVALVRELYSPRGG
ncbi:MAG: adenylyltransferase/cytidyltransferase family protein [Bryobacterales bacterium]|nr:adenylyltransferase/cytidyltransferase family protein [Bryobacterales bacterium]